jgi:predicted  nucleic acid-binding Zn-ribbon protein
MDFKSTIELELTVAKAQTTALKEALNKEEILLEDYNTQMVLLNSKIQVLKEELKTRYPNEYPIKTEIRDYRIPFGGC